MSENIFTPNKNQDFIILFSESVVGVHIKGSNETEVYEVISLTFPPTVEKRPDGNLYFKNNLKNNSNFKQALSLYLDNKDLWRNISFAIGYDDDDAGHFMSEALRENLISSGVNSKDIYRTPLTEAGYLLIQNFSNTETLKKFLFFQQDFRQIARSAGIRKNVGFSKIISLKLIYKFRNKSLSIAENDPVINFEGTSTATVATQYMTGES